jgi:GNAT superfamily N-acetyltransferase
MTEMSEEYRQGDYIISTDRSRLDIAQIHEYLSQHAYWALGRPQEVTERAIENSLCFGVYAGEEQVGFARVVTDYATFGWLCDVFILGAWRGRGLAKWLVETIVAHPALTGLKQILLATRDAHELYRNYGGFRAMEQPERWMVRRLVR